MRALIRRLWHLLRLSRVEADLAEEMDVHREMKERELAGLSTAPAETASAARRALGSVALAHDRSLDAWLWPWLDGFFHDLRFALRGLRRDRGAGIQRVDADVTLEDFATLQDSLAFDRDFMVNRILRSQLVGVSPYDPVSLATAPMVLILVALLACHIPSRRAMSVDPAVALRQD
jgi:hypothetical protein